MDFSECVIVIVIEQGEDRRSEEAGGEVEGEGALTPPDEDLETDQSRKIQEHEATHVPFRETCTHCMMGRERTHHHVTKQQSEDQSRRPTNAIDQCFMHLNSVVNTRTMSDESVPCIAVKEDRHQNIMSSVALKIGVEEPWTIERVVRFIDLLGLREITLKSDTESAIIAFGSRVTGCSE